SSLDDQIRSVFDRIRVTMSGQLEADLAVSTADILRAVADEQRALADARERSTAETRLEADQHLSVVRAEFARETEALRQGAAFEIGGVGRRLCEVRTEVEG